MSAEDNAEQREERLVPPVSWDFSPAFASLAALLLEGDARPSMLDRLRLAPAFLPALRSYMGDTGNDPAAAIRLFNRVSHAFGGYGGWSCIDGIPGFASYARASVDRPFPASPLAMAYVAAAGPGAKIAPDSDGPVSALTDIYLQCCSDIGAVQPFFCGCMAYANAPFTAQSCAPIRMAKLQKAFSNATAALQPDAPLSHAGAALIRAVRKAASMHMDPVAGAVAPTYTGLAITAWLADPRVWAGPKPDEALAYATLKANYGPYTGGTSILWCARQDRPLAAHLIDSENDSRRDAAIVLTISALASALFDAGLSLVLPTDDEVAVRETFGMRTLVADEPHAGAPCVSVRIWGGDAISVRHYGAFPAILCGGGAPARWSRRSAAPVQVCFDAIRRMLIDADRSGSPGPLARAILAEIGTGRADDVATGNFGQAEPYYAKRMAGIADRIVTYAKERGCATSRTGFEGLPAEGGTAVLIPRCAARPAGGV